MHFSTLTKYMCTNILNYETFSFDLLNSNTTLHILFINTKTTQDLSLLYLNLELEVFLRFTYVFNTSVALEALDNADDLAFVLADPIIKKKQLQLHPPQSQTSPLFYHKTIMYHLIL